MAKKIEYVVVNKCFHEKKLYRKGEVAVFPADVDVPHHFQKVGEVDVKDVMPVGKGVKVNNKSTVAS